MEGHDELIRRVLLKLPQLDALPASVESLGGAKTMDAAQSRVHTGRVLEPKSGSEQGLTDEGEVVVTALAASDRSRA